MVIVKMTISKQKAFKTLIKISSYLRDMKIFVQAKFNNATNVKVVNGISG